RAAANANALDACIPFSVEVRRLLTHTPFRRGARFSSTGCASGRCRDTAESAVPAAGSSVQGVRPSYWRSVTWRFGTGRSQQPECPETQRAAHRKYEEVHGMEVPPVDHLEEVGGCDEAEQGARRNEIRLHGVGRPISQ